MERGDVRRLFFALWPSDAVREEIHSKTRRFVTDGRAIPAANFHITVLFLGEIPQTRLEGIRRAGARASATAEGFEVSLDQVESFARSKVLCLTAAATPPALAALAEQLRFNLLAQQVNLQDQPLRPHVTLARSFSRPHPASGAPLIRWRVDELALVESERGRAGSSYAVIDRWPLPSMEQRHDAGR